MREVLLDLREPHEKALVRNFVATIGYVYEDEGEVFDPLEQPDYLSVPPQGAKLQPRTDMLVQTDMTREFVFRPWLAATQAELKFWGMLVDISSTAERREPVFRVLRESVVEPIEVGAPAVLAGLHLGVVDRIVHVHDIRLVPAAVGSDLSVARKAIGLRYDPYFNNANSVLSAALGKDTTVYGLAADLFAKQNGVCS